MLIKKFGYHLDTISCALVNNKYQIIGYMVKIDGLYYLDGPLPSEQI